jgi:hypothetical protein
MYHRSGFQQQFFPIPGKNFMTAVAISDTTYRGKLLIVLWLLVVATKGAEDALHTS